MEGEAIAGFPPEDGPSRLTKHALFEHTLAEMRLRGEPTEGMSALAPTRTETSSARCRRLIAAAEEFGLDKLQYKASPESLASRERRYKQYEEEEAAERAVFEAEAGDQWLVTTPSRSPFPSEGSRPSGSRDPRPASTRAASELDRPRSHSPRGDGSWREGEERQGAASLDYKRRGPGGYYDSGVYHYESPPKSVDWNHSDELRRLQGDMIEAAKFRPERRVLYRTLDMGAFADETDAGTGTGQKARESDAVAGNGKKASDQKGQDDANKAGSVEETKAEPVIPSLFPPHREVNGIIELSGYLAASRYIISLGGPPLPDLKYGIVVVPAGDEGLLFEGYGDQAVMPADLAGLISKKSKALQREEMAEHRQKMMNEMLNGVGSEPEIDDDDRKFYRRRWRARRGLPPDDSEDEAQPEPVDDVAAAGPSGTQPAVEGADMGSATGKQAVPSARSSASRALLDESAVALSATTSAKGKAPERAPHAHSEVDFERQPPATNDRASLPKPAREGNADPSTAAETSEHAGRPAIDLDEDQVAASAATAASVPGTPVPAASAPAASAPTASTPGTPVQAASSSLRSSATTPAPMSAEACQVLEEFLRAERKKRKRNGGGRRRLLDTLRHGRQLASGSPGGGGRKATAGGLLPRPAVLLEVAGAFVALANGEMAQNPGIDAALWEAVRLDLAAKSV